MAPGAARGVVVIGLGNEYRSDDGVGRVVARALAAQAHGGLVVKEETGEVAGLLEAWQGADTAVLVDAVVTGSAPGTLHRFDARAQTIPRECFPCSTHAFGLPEAVELGRAMDALPRRLVVLGVEAGTVAPGRGLSSAVAAAVPEVLARVVGEIEHGRCTRPR